MHKKVGQAVHIYTTNAVTSKLTIVKHLTHHKQYKQQKYMKNSLNKTMSTKKFLKKCISAMVQTLTGT